MYCVVAWNFPTFRVHHIETQTCTCKHQLVYTLPPSWCRAQRRTNVHCALGTRRKPECDTTTVRRLHKGHLCVSTVPHRGARGDARHPASVHEGAVHQEPLPVGRHVTRGCVPHDAHPVGDAVATSAGGDAVAPREAPPPPTALDCSSLLRGVVPLHEPKVQRAGWRRRSPPPESP
jgi:hypothetical protein